MEKGVTKKERMLRVREEGNDQNNHMYYRNVMKVPLLWTVDVC